MDAGNKIHVKDCDDEIVISMEKNYMFGSDPSSSLKNMGFYEYTLSELNLPSAEELLAHTLEIQKEVGLRGWCSQGIESQTYRGFSLTYNPDFQGDGTGIYHQTWGSTRLPQNYGRVNGLASFDSKKNSYYDSYAFRKRPPLIEKNLNSLLDKFSMPILRSRVAWHFAYGKNKENIKAWHIDEFPYHILRINIPLQTSDEHVIDIVGDDDFDNYLDIKNKHLEVGKVYIWNTRIPHCVSLNSLCKNPNPRIHMVLGLCPWFDYDQNNDSFTQSDLYGLNLDYIIRNKLFIKSL